MADVPGKFYRATKVRTGVAPSSAGSIEGEVLPPVNPPGSSLNSVGLTMPSAFTVSNSPLTANGTIGVAGAGTVAQYIRGDGSLADFPESSGGGSSVSYYLNGSVDQGTIGGIAYKELSKVPILGAGTDFSINADGYIASFITDAGDPSLLEIPGGNWNFETYFSASSSGGTPTFYVELYKVSGTTATLIASSSSAPELIAFGTNLTPYFSSLAVPTTTLALTDRLAVRYYVTHSGRTITLHTENNHLCQIITTFTTGLTALNGLTAQVQNFAVGTTGTDFNIASATATHTFNLPTASATNRGALSSADWSTFNAKQNALTLTTSGTSGAATLVGATLNIPNYGSALSDYLPLTGGTLTGPLGVTGNVTLIAGGSGSSFNRQISLGSGTAYNYQVRANGDDFQLIEAGSHVFLEYDYGGSLGAGTIRLYNNTVSTASFTGSSFIRTGGTSSQYLMADGSVSTLTNPITGSGNSGTIPVFTGSTTIGNSIIQSNSTQVNIVGNGSQLLFDSLGSTKDGGIQYINSFQLLIFNSRGTGSSINLGDTNLDFNTNSSGNPKLRITETGAATFSSSVTSSSFIRSGGTSSQYLMADGSVSTLSNAITGTGTSGQLAYFNGTTSITSESNLFWDSTNDRLGIGINTPNAELQVQKSNDVTFALSNSNSITTGNRGSIAWYNSAVSTVALIKAIAITDNVGTELEFYTNKIGGSLTRALILRQNQSAEFAASLKTNASIEINDSSQSTLDLQANRQLINFDDYGRIRFGGRFNSFSYGNGASINSIAVGNWSSTNYGSNLTFSTVAQNSTTLNTRMTITSGGNVGIGTPSPNSILETVAGSNGVGLAIRARALDDTYSQINFLNNSGNNNNAIIGVEKVGTNGGLMYFYTKPNGGSITEGARITSSGFFKASNTGTYASSTGNYHELINSATGNNIAYLWNTSANPYGPYVSFSASAPNNGTNYYFYCDDTSAARFIVYSNGGISNYQANNTNLSDERTKKEISPLESYWDKFKAIEIVKFKYKDQTHDDFNIGVIAQQVEKVAPEFVDVDGWDNKTQGNEVLSQEEPIKSIYTADLHHATIKVLQEAMAKIEAMQKEIDTLKN